MDENSKIQLFSIHLGINCRRILRKMRPGINNNIPTNNSNASMTNSSIGLNNFTSFSSVPESSHYHHNCPLQQEEQGMPNGHQSNSAFNSNGLLDSDHIMDSLLPSI